MPQLFVIAHQRHPTQGIVGQKGTLKQCGIGQEVVGFNLCQSPLAFTLFDPGFTGRALTLFSMGLPGRQRLRGDVTEVVIVLQFEQFALRWVAFNLFALAYGNKEARITPTLGLILKFTLLPAGVVT